MKYSVRFGDWKPLSFADGRGKARQELYHLADDPGEEHNLAKQQPERLQQMVQKLTAIKEAGRSRP